MTQLSGTSQQTSLANTEAVEGNVRAVRRLQHGGRTQQRRQSLSVGWITGQAIFQPFTRAQPIQTGIQCTIEIDAITHDSISKRRRNDANARC
jgi:hypothetical protein